MNPPFLPWRLIDQTQREGIKHALGDLYLGQSDTALAFVAKAISSLKAGAVLATLVPGALLDSRAASRLRSRIAGDPSLSIELIGLFRGFKYFARAAVEPAFLCITRRASEREIVVVLAESGAEDRSIRGTRLLGSGMSLYGSGFEVTSRERATLSDVDWTPRPLRGTKTVAQWRIGRLAERDGPVQRRLGIRTGENECSSCRRETSTRTTCPNVNDRSSGRLRTVFAMRGSCRADSCSILTGKGGFPSRPRTTLPRRRRGSTAIGWFRTVRNSRNGKA